MVAPGGNGHSPQGPVLGAVDHVDRGLRLWQVAGIVLPAALGLPAVFFRLGSLGTALAVVAVTCVAVSLWSLPWDPRADDGKRFRLEGFVFPTIAAIALALVGPTSLGEWSLRTIGASVTAAAGLFLVLRALFVRRRGRLGGWRKALAATGVAVLLTSGVLVSRHNETLRTTLERARVGDVEVLGVTETSVPASPGGEEDPCNGTIGTGAPPEIKIALVAAFRRQTDAPQCPTATATFDPAAEAWTQGLPEGTLYARERGPEGLPEGSLVPAGVELASRALKDLAPLAAGEFPSGGRPCGDGELHAYRTRSGEIRALVLRRNGDSAYHAVPGPMVAGAWWSVARRARTIPFPKGAARSSRGSIEQEYDNLREKLSVRKDQRAKGPTLGEVLELCPVVDVGPSRPNVRAVAAMGGHRLTVSARAHPSRSGPQITPPVA